MEFKSFAYFVTFRFLIAKELMLKFAFIVF